jgi:hypothetical protein
MRARVEKAYKRSGRDDEVRPSITPKSLEPPPHKQGALNRGIQKIQPKEEFKRNQPKDPLLYMSETPQSLNLEPQTRSPTFENSDPKPQTLNPKLGGGG